MSERIQARDEMRNLLHRMLRVGVSVHAPRLGDLGVKMGLLTQDALDSALAVQRTTNGSRLIGEVLVEGGILSRVQVQNLIDEQDRIAMSSSDAAELEDDVLSRLSQQLSDARSTPT